VGKRVVVLWSLRLRVSAREGFSCGRRPHWALRASMVTICAERTQFPTGSGGPRSRRRGAIMQNEPNSGSKRAKRTQFGPGRGVNVRNEAKLGGTRVCGQRQLPRGPWLGRGVKRAERTQFRSGRRLRRGAIVRNKHQPPQSARLTPGWSFVPWGLS
jgi:hypothetical protein